MVGSALVGFLKENGFNNILKKTHDELDLINQGHTRNFFDNEKPEYVFLAAAKVGGIFANNKYKAQFLYENLMFCCSVVLPGGPRAQGSLEGIYSSPEE